MARGEEAGDPAATALGKEHAEVIEANRGVVADALQSRLVEKDSAIARAGECPEERTDANGISAGENAEVARAAPNGIGGTCDVIGDGPSDHEAAKPGMKPIKAAADPAVEQRRADGDEAAWARIGILLEDLAHENAAHAVGHDVDDVAFRAGEEFLQATSVFVEALHHGAIPELADAVADRLEAFSQKTHFPAANDGAVDEDDGGCGVGGRSRCRIEPWFGHEET